MAPRAPLPPATLEGLFVDQQLGFLRMGLGIDAALAVLGPPDADGIFGPGVRMLSWGSLEAGFEEPDAAILSGAEPDEGATRALTLLMLEPDPSGWQLPAGLRAQGWWPPRDTPLKAFLDHETLRHLSFDVHDAHGLTSVMFNRDGGGPTGRTLRQGDFRKQRTIETERSSSVGRDRATQALFQSQGGFFRLHLSA